MQCIGALVLLAIAVFARTAVADDRGYPTTSHAGFHHNALLYIDGDHPPEQLAMWLTGSHSTLDSRQVIFDTVTLIAERTPSQAATAYSTSYEDWVWLLETKLAGPSGILANLAEALTRLDMGSQPLQVIIMLPYFDALGQQTFSPTLNLSDSQHRQQAVQWYVQTVKEQVKRHSRLHLWGIYLMREDITFGLNEQITREISDIVHSEQLRLLWIPYTSASNWNHWAELGIDVAILQPGYAFATPLAQGTFHAGRLRAAAKLARKYGLGVEIETNQGASTEYETALLQNYLAQGSIDGYQYAPTAYFLGNYETIARSKRACDLLRTYALGIRVQPTFVPDVVWTWTDDPVRQAAVNISSESSPRGIRVNWSPRHSNWRGRVTVEACVEEAGMSTWMALSSTEVGEKNWRDEDWTSTLLPFSLMSSQAVLSIRVSFSNCSFFPSLTDEDLIIEQLASGVALQASTGAPYRILPAMYTPDPQYADATDQTLWHFHRGLLTDGQWSSGEWQPAMSIGWLDDPSSHSYVRIALDFGRLVQIEQIVVRTHGGTASAINWPNIARALVSADCIPFSPLSTSDCAVKSYPCTDRVITGGTDTNQGGILSFTFSSSLRWATLEFQPNAWLMIDEIRAYSHGRDISNQISYRLLTPPTAKTSASFLAYPDNGVRLTDGALAGMMGSLTGWLKGESRTIIIDLLTVRSIRETSVWALIKPDWSISAPASIVVSTSLDGKAWLLFGQHSQMQTGERMLDAQRLFLKAERPRRTRYVKFEFPTDQAAPGWWTMVSEVSATD